MGRDIRLSADRIAGYRNFVNKLWNADRYRQLKAGDLDASGGGSCAMPDVPRLMPTRWIRSRLAAAVAEGVEELHGLAQNDVDLHVLAIGEVHPRLRLVGREVEVPRRAL